MKRVIAISTALVWSFIFAVPSWAQNEDDTLRYKIESYRGLDTMMLSTPDIRTWHPDDITIDRHSVTPMISMTSLTGLRKEFPSRVFIILPNNTLEAWGRVNISNGQAQNWGPFPNSYLDARTLSFPAPR